jgi:succinate dehydrogenase hydrophobic anchor subunit
VLVFATDAISAVSVTYSFVFLAWLAAGRTEPPPGIGYVPLAPVFWILPLTILSVTWLLYRAAQNGVRYMAWESKHPSRERFVIYGSLAIFLVIFIVMAAYFSVLG